MSQIKSLPVDLPIDAIRAYCETQPVRRLALFGSVLRDDFTSASDIDMLVDYHPDAPITLLDMARQELDLTDIVGRNVDLRTRNELSLFFRDDVLAEAVVIYER
jgi:hypothetical protein